MASTIADNLAALSLEAAGIPANNGRGVKPPPDGWPEPLRDAAYHGLLGQVLREIEPRTSADPAAILFHLLSAVGNMVNRNARVEAGSDQHHLKINCLIIGSTSSGAKGTAKGHALRYCERVNDEWLRNCVKGGLSSGEGLIHHVRDPRHEDRQAKKDERDDADSNGFVNVMVDAGVEDKRLFAVETEFGSVLGRKRQDGNTLSEIIRQAWDGGDLRTLTKTSPDKATGAHVSIVGHITPEELKEKTAGVDASNGFLNRFLMVCSRRTRLLPMEKPIPYSDLNPYVPPLASALKWARETGPVFELDDEAAELWCDVAFAELSERPDGIVGQVTSRAIPYVLRIASIYALLDKSQPIRLHHLRAALEVWRYADDSAHFVWGGRIENKDAAKILSGLRKRPDHRLSRSQIRELMGGGVPADRIDTALLYLKHHGWVRPGKSEPGTGRPTHWIELVHTGLSQPLRSLNGAA